MKKGLQRLYLFLIFVLLYAPIVTLVVLSFNDSKTRAKWGGFTTRWYVSMFQNAQIMDALANTLLIAFLSALFATIIGTMACMGIMAMKKRSRILWMGIANIPMLNAEIVTGISLMLLFIAFGNIFQKITGMNISSMFGFTTVLLGHITFNIPFVILSVMPKLKQLNKATYEAALDLGASPVHAFFRVILPDIMPGVLSGFLMAFTMSLDDFIITHFVKGAGFDTLSTKIYTEVKKGIKPEMYALSTLLFVSVLVLLFLVNRAPVKNDGTTAELANRQQKRNRNRKWLFGTAGAVVLAVCAFWGVSSLSRSSESASHTGTGTSTSQSTGSSGQNASAIEPKRGGEVIVYNWGEYMDPEVIKQFEEETGTKVIYEEFETNEIMFPKVQAGAVAYDLVCPSDYMIQRMISNDLLAEINFDNLPNLKNIDQTYLDQSRQFDKENKYSIPYCWGTVGILYNKTMVKEPVDSWGILWDEQYKDNILMQDSVRDAFAVALKYLGYSLNTSDKAELEEAKQLLLKQKPLLQAYVIDQVRDKMIGGEAALGVIYSGEAIFTKRENPDLEYVVPKEGSNIWIDSWVIPKNAKNKENAEAFINFLCRPDIALKNFEYITYSTPNKAAKELIQDEDIKNSKVAFPDPETLTNCETYSFLGDDMDAYYNGLWREVKSK